MLPEGHKFAFLCSHDSMIAAVLAALRVIPYELPNTIETQTPLDANWYLNNGLKHVALIRRDMSALDSYIKAQTKFEE